MTDMIDMIDMIDLYPAVNQLRRTAKAGSDDQLDDATLCADRTVPDLAPDWRPA